MPCQCTAVRSPRRFITVISTGSPRLSTSGGPGTAAVARADGTLSPLRPKPKPDSPPALRRSIVSVILRGAERRRHLGGRGPRHREP